jgi:hypothetical protein
MRLLYLDSEGIDILVKTYEKDTKALKEELLRITWFMRGGISYHDAQMLSHEERELVAKLIEGNLETTKESGLPFF